MDSVDVNIAGLRSELTFVNNRAEELCEQLEKADQQLRSLQQENSCMFETIQGMQALVTNSQSAVNQAASEFRQEKTEKERLKTRLGEVERLREGDARRLVRLRTKLHYYESLDSIVELTRNLKTNNVMGSNLNRFMALENEHKIELFKGLEASYENAVR